MPESNACQLVLKYILMHRSTFVKAFHNRVYAYSSGSKFSNVCDPIRKWLDELVDRRQKWEDDPPAGVRNPLYVIPQLPLRRFKLPSTSFQTALYVVSNCPLRNFTIPSTSANNSLYVISQIPLRRCRSTCQHTLGGSKSPSGPEAQPEKVG